LTLFC